MALSRSPVRAAAGTLTALHAPELTVRAIRGDREAYCSSLSVRPALPVRGGCVSGFWLEQAHADQPLVVIDALDHVSVQLELGDDGGREGNPAGVQLGKSDRLVAGLAQALQQPLLLDVSEHHRRIGPLHLFPRQSTYALCDPGHRCGDVAHSAAASFEHRANAWLATSAKSTRSTSVANRLGPSTLRARRRPQGAPQPVEQPYPAQRPRNNDLELPRRARQRHPLLSTSVNLAIDAAIRRGLSPDLVVDRAQVGRDELAVVGLARGG